MSHPNSGLNLSKEERFLRQILGEPSREHGFELDSTKTLEAHWHEGLDGLGLNEKEKRAVMLSYGLEDGENHSYAEIAKDLGCTEEEAEAYVNSGMIKFESK